MLRELRTQPRLVGWPPRLADGMAQDAPHFHFHAVAMRAGALRQPLLDLLLDDAPDQLGDAASPENAIMLSG